MFKAVRISIVTLVLLALAAALFAASGSYNIGADDHHTAMMLAIIDPRTWHKKTFRIRSARFGSSNTASK